MGRRIRISGLIRLADYVRHKLAAPLTISQREQLQNQVRHHLGIIDGILRANKVRPVNLPPPSRRAYRFLTDLDWTQVHVSSNEQPTFQNKPDMLRWRGLGGFISRTMACLARDISASEVTALGEGISRTSRRIEGTLSRSGVGPDGLSPATREQRGWLAFFAREENLAAYVQARQMAGRVIDAAGARSRQFPPPLDIELKPMKGIFKLRATRERPVLSLPTPMISFDESAFATVAQLIFHPGPHSKHRVIELMTGEGYQAIAAELEALGGIVEQSRGAVHDLAASFDRVNTAYFGGQMERPRLAWSRTFTGRKFGHYDWILDTVMVSRTLDSPGVPEFVVDFLMFHELLHKYHGLYWVNGRGYAHTAEFYASERKFTAHAEAEAILKQLARQA